MKTNLKPIAIFKPGRHLTNGGDVFEFSDADVAATAAAYSPSVHNAPFVVGHPELTSPAYGWAASLYFENGLLSAIPADVQPEFADWVNKKLYGTVSASFYDKGHPNNPVPGVYYLRHVGFLGAHPPSIKGLPPPQFAEGDKDEIVFEFSEFSEEEKMTDEEKAALEEAKAKLEQQRLEFAEGQNQLEKQKSDLAQRELALAQKELEAKKREFVEFAESQIKEGRLLPCNKAGVVELMAHLDDGKKLEFAEGDEQKSVGSLAWFKGFVSGLPKAIEFGEMKTGDDVNAGLTDKQIAQKAQIYHKKMTEQGISLSFAEAVDAVAKGEE